MFPPVFHVDHTTPFWFLLPKSHMGADWGGGLPLAFKGEFDDILCSQKRATSPQGQPKDMQ